MNVPAGSNVVVMFGGAGKLIVIVSCFCADCCGAPVSTTLNVGDLVWFVVGVPLMTPPELRFRPVGRAGEPLAKLHVFVPVPPVANKVVLYGTVTVPLGNGELVCITSVGGAAPIINCSVLVAVWGVGGV